MLAREPTRKQEVFGLLPTPPDCSVGDATYPGSHLHLAMRKAWGGGALGHRVVGAWRVRMGLPRRHCQPSWLCPGRAGGEEDGRLAAGGWALVWLPLFMAAWDRARRYMALGRRVVGVARPRGGRDKVHGGRGAVQRCGVQRRARRRSRGSQGIRGVGSHAWEGRGGLGL